MSKIYIACGHGTMLDGTWDSGCSYDGYTEAALMLPITKVAVKLLREKGVTVYTDADSGNNKNMVASVDEANKIKADLYISIHCDYSGAPTGVMPLYVSEQGKKIALALETSIVSMVGIKSRLSQKRIDLYELNETDMPACILETGSIKADLNTLKNKSELYGKAICAGVCEYLGIKENPVNPVVTNDYKKYKALREVNVYKDHSIKSGKIGKLNPGSIYTASKWYGDDWCYIPYVKGWAPIKGSLGTYLQQITKLTYTVTNDAGINIYPDAAHKGKMIANVKKGSELTATKWNGSQAYFPSLKGWGAISCLTVGNRREVFLKILNQMGKTLAKNNFKYSTSNLKTSLAAAMKYDHRIDCAHYVSFALQALNILPVGQYIWLNKKINGNGTNTIKKSKLVTISYPNKLPKYLDLQPGDIVGFGYTVNGKAGQHTQVYAGKDKFGNMLWYSAGTSDVNGKNYGPKQKPTYANRPVNVWIRIK